MKPDPSLADFKRELGQIAQMLSKSRRFVTPTLLQIEASGVICCSDLDRSNIHALCSIRD
jgi:hypothetical protein